MTRKRKIRLYHATTVDRADSIMLNGFRDHATVRRMFSGTTIFPPGVWFGDVPALDDELFDGIGLFGFDAERQTFIAVDVCLPLRGIRSSAMDDTWPGTQYWGLASIWNQFPRTRFDLDEIIELRFSMEPTLIPKMREWIAEQDPRPYNTEFHARVKKLLEATAAVLPSRCEP